VTSPSFEKLIALKAQLLREGTDIIDLSMINPDLSPPRILIDRLLEATNKMQNQRYAVSRGIRRTREAFADKYATRFDVKLEPEDEVCLTFGTKDALNLLMHVFARQPKKVLLPEPTYPGFFYAAQYAGLEWDTYPLSDNEEETLVAIKERLNSGVNYSALFVNYPNNPTGLVASPAFYAALAEVAVETETYVVNDFVYGEMQYDAASPVSLLSNDTFGEYGLETYSLSKAYSVPGWRVGAIMGRSSLVREVAQLKSQVDYGLYLPLQLASAAALTAGDTIMEEITLSYSRRAQVLSAILKRHGWLVREPGAGCSVWAKLPSGSGDDYAFAERALCHGVSVTPGTQFGSRCKDFIRFALVASEEKIRLVEERLFQ
jgi:alanine-synthesizing transaminase